MNSSQDFFGGEYVRTILPTTSFHEKLITNFFIKKIHNESLLKIQDFVFSWNHLVDSSEDFCFYLILGSSGEYVSTILIIPSFHEKRMFRNWLNRKLLKMQDFVFSWKHIVNSSQDFFYPSISASSGEYVPVMVDHSDDLPCRGVYFLHHGLQRRIRITIGNLF